MEGVGMPGKGEGRGGEGRKNESRGGKKSKKTPFVNSCLHPWRLTFLLYVRLVCYTLLSDVQSGE